MTRQALASEARSLSRAIWASVPVPVRIASIVQAFLRQAFTNDDLYVMIGVQALSAMETAGTPGKIHDSTIEDLRPFIKRNALGKLKPYAIWVGRQIYNLSMGGKHKISLPTLEEAWSNYSEMLLRHPLESSKNVGQALKYISNGFTHRIQDALDKQTGHGEARRESGGEIGEAAHREHETPPDESAIWHQVEKRFKSEPLLMGPKGEPWGWIYIEGESSDRTQNEIIDAWMEASRKHGGGKEEITRSMFLRWINNPERKSLMQHILKPLDPEVAKALKVAAARGALETCLLLPSERNLLALLV